MKNKIMRGLSGIAAAVLMSGCVVEGPLPPGPVVTVFPDYYVWDGYEYVGVIDGEYYYLGPGNVWVACDPVRVHRFDVWVHAHPDWRAHATRNEHYHGNPHGYGHDRDHDRGHGH